jgi:hypothetical protein
MSEKPLERLNYFNGQRLEAADLKTEQDYHIRTRRWLNKSLYTAGIARGLEVRKVNTDPEKKPPEPPTVSISPGLALDNEGREIILLEEIQERVESFVGTDPTKVEGKFLVIEYNEEAHSHANRQCVPGSPSPSLIQAKPKLSWVSYIPQPGSNQIVLAQVELKTGCNEIEKIGLNQRQLVRNASTASVRQYALEGEREVAYIPKESFPKPKPVENIKVSAKIYFHIRGQDPKSVTLYLRAELFSQLYYTELGTHIHSTTGATTIPDHVIPANQLNHFHSLSNVITDVENPDDRFDGLTPHNHDIFASFLGPFQDGAADGYNSIQLGKFNNDTDTDGKHLYPAWLRHRVNNHPDDNKFPFIIEGAHRHALISVGAVGTHEPAYTDSSCYSGIDPVDKSHIPFKLLLKHDPTTGNPDIDPFGIEFPSRSGSPLNFIDDLQVFIWRVEENHYESTPDDNQTQKILKQISLYNPNWGLPERAGLRLGNSSSKHDLVTKGTGAIQLNFLEGLEFHEGEYCIELRLEGERTKANGGKIHYNLYIE